jgi:hypothetical protein
MTALGDNEILMVFAKPPGGEIRSIGKARSSTDLRPSSWLAKAPSRASMTDEDVPILWAMATLKSDGELGTYPDPWQLKAIKDGRVLIDKPITEFNSMAAALNDCGKRH